MIKNFLILGGAGYIGSHMVQLLCDEGYAPVVLDDLSTGKESSVNDKAIFYQGDIADSSLLTEIINKHQIQCVMHFAASVKVGESVIDPQKYYVNNVVKSIQMLDVVRQAGVDYVIFSSTAAVYGDKAPSPVNEGCPTAPINPYGESKLMVEKVLADYHKAYGLKYATMRYFNAAGAHENGHIGAFADDCTHLIPSLLKVAAGKRETFNVFGDDYDTEDGTCIRDFVHVMDICKAHLAALHYLENGGESTVFNVGTGTGFSVKTMIDAARDITEKEITVTILPRRAGDATTLVADSTKLQQLCGWQMAHSSVDGIIGSAWVCGKKWSSSRTAMN